MSSRGLPRDTPPSRNRAGAINAHGSSKQYSRVLSHRYSHKSLDWQVEIFLRASLVPFKIG